MNIGIGVDVCNDFPNPHSTIYTPSGVAVTRSSDVIGWSMTHENAVPLLDALGCHTPCFPSHLNDFEVHGNTYMLMDFSCNTAYMIVYSLYVYTSANNFKWEYRPYIYTSKIL